MADKVDRILEEMAEQRRRETAETVPPRAEDARREKVEAFRLQLDLDGEDSPMPEVPAASAAEPEAADLPAASAVEPEAAASAREAAEEEAEAAAVREAVYDAPAVFEQEPADGKKKKRRRKDPRAQAAWGFLRGILYVTLVLTLAGVLSMFIIQAGLDIVGIKKPGEVATAEVEVLPGESMREVAQKLKDAGIIKHPLYFIAYARVTKSEASLQPGVFTLAADMGYGEVLRQMGTGTGRSTVRVRLQEGLTLDGMGEILEENGVCTSEEFHRAVLEGDYSSYDFVAAIPTAEQGAKYARRTYRLEGYLFPDTYEFFLGSSGETVVRKMLDTFNVRVSVTMRSRIAAKEMTLDDAIILASIVQGEAGDGEWDRVARVLVNRIENPKAYGAATPLFQCDSTARYAQGLDKQYLKMAPNVVAYDTYQSAGLPPGAICNPGLAAIDAVINPSADTNIMKCYYFATDADGVTYYSKTRAEHEAICREKKIGMYAD